jgi:hypothetical protein
MSKNIVKQILITKLIENDIDTVKTNLDNNDVWWLGQILENGFIGYKKQTIKELIQEATERGILDEKGFFTEPYQHKFKI